MLFLFAFGVNAQEQVVLRQTFIKVEEGNNYAEDLKEKFSKFSKSSYRRRLPPVWMASLGSCG